MNIFKLIITLLNLPRLIMHAIFYFIHMDVCKKDVEVTLNFMKINCSSFMGFLYLLVFQKTFRNLFYFRIGRAQYIVRFLLPPHPCFYIQPNVKLGPGCLCIHPFSTVINAEKIGDNFTIRNNVTIGNKNDIKGDNPIIGNNVCVNVNSVIVGNIHIGNNVTVGAGSVVVKDVPDNAVVVGNPARILRFKKE